MVVELFQSAKVHHPCGLFENRDREGNCGMDKLPYISGFAILPGNPPTQCPELLTEEEAIRYLRLENDPHASRTLRYYREKGLLRSTVIGRHLRYRRIELEQFLERQTGIYQKSR